MKNCKKCKKPINLKISGVPQDMCWGCLNEEEQNKVVEQSIIRKQRWAK